MSSPLSLGTPSPSRSPSPPLTCSAANQTAMDSQRDTQAETQTQIETEAEIEKSTAVKRSHKRPSETELEAQPPAKFARTAKASAQSRIANYSQAESENEIVVDDSISSSTTPRAKHRCKKGGRSHNAGMAAAARGEQSQSKEASSSQSKAEKKGPAAADRDKSPAQDQTVVLDDTDDAGKGAGSKTTSNSKRSRKTNWTTAQLQVLLNHIKGQPRKHHDDVIFVCLQR